MKPKGFIYSFCSIVIGLSFLTSFAVVVHSQYFIDEKIPVRGIHFLMGSDVDFNSQGMDNYGYQPPQNQNLPQFTLAKDLGEVDVNLWVIIMFLTSITLIISNFALKNLTRDVIVFSASSLLFIVAIIFNVSSSDYITTATSESAIEGGTGLYTIIIITLFLMVYSMIALSRKQEIKANIIEENNLFQELK